MIDSGLTLGEISERLQDEFDVTPAKVKESVINLINELITEKLVEVAMDSQTGTLRKIRANF